VSWVEGLGLQAADPALWSFRHPEHCWGLLVSGQELVQRGTHAGSPAAGFPSDGGSVGDGVGLWTGRREKQSCLVLAPAWHRLWTVQSKT